MLPGDFRARLVDLRSLHMVLLFSVLSIFVGFTMPLVYSFFGALLFSACVLLCFLRVALACLLGRRVGCRAVVRREEEEEEENNVPRAGAFVVRH